MQTRSRLLEISYNNNNCSEIFHFVRLDIALKQLSRKHWQYLQMYRGYTLRGLAYNIVIGDLTSWWWCSVMRARDDNYYDTDVTELWFAPGPWDTFSINGVMPDRPRTESISPSTLRERLDNGYGRLRYFNQNSSNRCRFLHASETILSTHAPEVQGSIPWLATGFRE